MVLDRWLPTQKNKDDIKVIKQDRENIKSSIDKLQMTNLITLQILNSKSKAGDLLFARRQMAGKRLRDDPGVWWLDEKALTSSRREPWPCRGGTSGASSTCKEESELHDKHHLLWKELNLMENYLELGVSRDSSAGPEVEGINIVVESGSGKLDSIILVENRGQPTDGDIIG